MNWKKEIQLVSSQKSAKRHQTIKNASTVLDVSAKRVGSVERRLVENLEISSIEGGRGTRGGAVLRIRPNQDHFFLLFFFLTLKYRASTLKTEIFVKKIKGRISVYRGIVWYHFWYGLWGGGVRTLPPPWIMGWDNRP